RECERAHHRIPFLVANQGVEERSGGGELVLPREGERRRMENALAPRGRKRGDCADAVFPREIRFADRFQRGRGQREDVRLIRLLAEGGKDPRGGGGFANGRAPVA